MTKRIHVVGAAIIRDGKVLAARRSPDMPLPGKWEFPGGKVEQGERPETALAREIEEELDIRIRVGEFLGTGTADQDARIIELDVYVCEISDGVPNPHEHDRLEWVDAGGLEQLDWAEADIPILPEVASRLRREGGEGDAG